MQVLLVTENGKEVSLQDEEEVFLKAELETIEPTVQPGEIDATEDSEDAPDELHLVLQEVHTALEVVKCENEGLPTRVGELE